MSILRFEILGRIWLEATPVARFKLLADGKEIASMATLHPGKKVVLTITDIKDASGLPATPQDVPEYTVDKTGYLGLFPSSDGMSADVTYITGSPVPCVVSVKVDSVVKTVEFSTAAGAVAAFTLNVGPEVDV